MEAEKELLESPTSDDSTGRPEICPILDPDSDLLILEGFNEVEARTKLLNYGHVAKISLSTETQKEIGLQIGINVSAEHPWKQVSRRTLLDYLNDDRKEVKKFRDVLRKMGENDLILVGYASTLSEDEDIFLFFEDEEIAKEASILIQKLEANERRKAIAAIHKYPRPWKSYGSENEVDQTIRRKTLDMVDVEVQSIYPIDVTPKPFTQRRTDDAYDGYVELIPDKTDKQIIQRKRIDVAIQSAPFRVNLEQQSDPTFPANAWSQYLYEITKNDSEAHLEAIEEAMRAAKKKSKIIPNDTPDPLSDKVSELLKTLEFNEVDMYRNEYPYIAKRKIPKYTTPYFTEVFSFTEMAKSIERFVCAMDWHPILSGICAVAYTFSAINTSENIRDKIDKVKRAVLSPNPVLLWSFDNPLHPKLELETPREITAVSFCPYDADILIGGTINGQLILWDMKDRLEKIETEEILTPAQQKYRNLMRLFLRWTRQSNQDYIVRPTAITDLEASQKGPITKIRWLGTQQSVSAVGQIRRNLNQKCRFFLTSSLDGTVAFWDLDTQPTAEAKKIAAQKRSKMPDFMIQEESEYSHLNRNFQPMFVLVYNRPLSYMVIDKGIFKHIPIDEPKNRKLSTRVKHQIEEIPIEDIRHHVIASTITGQISIFTWEVTDTTATAEVRREMIQQAETFADVHDGPIVRIGRNPFIDNLFLSIGRDIVALWREDQLLNPIFWRRRPCKLTDCKWSIRRPAVFFLSRTDGSIEAWDILNRTDEPCLVDSLGGNIVTFCGQHLLTLPKETICIGDYNSSLRTLVVPSALTKQVPNEIELLENNIAREINRMNHLKKWQDSYYMSNSDIREARKRAAEEAQAEMDRLDKERKELEEIRMKKEEFEAKKAEDRAKRKNVFDMPERLQKKFDEMNIKRLMKILMSMKMVDPALLAVWTKPEKERIAYNDRKKEAIAESFRRIMDEYTTLRARLMPIEKPDESRINFVNENVKQLLDDDAEVDEFEKIEQKTLGYINSHNIRKELSYSQILYRARQRRDILNKTLGSNTKHRDSYAKMKNIRQMQDYNALRDTAPSSQSLQSIPEIEEEAVVESSINL